MKHLPTSIIALKPWVNSRSPRAVSRHVGTCWRPSVASASRKPPRKQVYPLVLRMPDGLIEHGLAQDGWFKSPTQPARPFHSRSHGVVVIMAILALLGLLVIAVVIMSALWGLALMVYVVVYPILIAVHIVLRILRRKHNEPRS